jgi:hypothetical protein
VFSVISNDAVGDQCAAEYKQSGSLFVHSCRSTTGRNQRRDRICTVPIDNEGGNPSVRKDVKIRMGLALLLLLLAGTAVAHGQEITHNGYWWAGQSQSFKLGFATGVAIAMTGNCDAAVFRCLAAKNSGSVPDNLRGVEALTACQQTPEVEALNYSNLRIGQLVDGVDEFYRDFRNKNILIDVAMRYVKDELRGKTAKELEDELGAFRQSANK